MYCPNCGCNVTDEAVFCPDCGAKISDYLHSGTAEPVADDSVVTPDDSDNGPVNAQPGTVYEPYTSGRYEQPFYGTQYIDPEEAKRQSDASTAFGLGVASIIFLLLPGFVVLTIILSAVGMAKGNNALRSPAPLSKASSGKLMCQIAFWLTVALIILAVIGCILSVVFAVSIFDRFGIPNYVEEFFYSL